MKAGLMCAVLVVVLVALPRESEAAPAEATPAPKGSSQLSSPPMPPNLSPGQLRWKRVQTALSPTAWQRRSQVESL